MAVKSTFYSGKLSFGCFPFWKKSEHFRALAVFPVDRKIESKLAIFPLISKMELFEQHDDGPGFVGIRFCKEW